MSTTPRRKLEISLTATELQVRYGKGGGQGNKIRNYLIKLVSLIEILKAVTVLVVVVVVAVVTTTITIIMLIT